MPVPILDPVQVLDEEIAPARRVAEELAHLGGRLRIDAAALRRRANLRWADVARSSRPIVHPEEVITQP
jgi:hypothetical protein